MDKNYTSNHLGPLFLLTAGYLPGLLLNILPDTVGGYSEKLAISASVPDQMDANITGDCGTGKTTIIRKFKDYLDSSQYLVMYLANSQLTPRHFYKGMLEQLGCEAKFYS